MRNVCHLSQSVLMIPVEHHAVFGAYTCIAENIHGKLEKVLMLTEGAKPGTPHIKPIKIYPDGFDLSIQVMLKHKGKRMTNFNFTTEIYLFYQNLKSIIKMDSNYRY